MRVFKHARRADVLATTDDRTVSVVGGARAEVEESERESTCDEEDEPDNGVEFGECAVEEDDADQRKYDVGDKDCQKEGFQALGIGLD